MCDAMAFVQCLVRTKEQMLYMSQPWRHKYDKVLPSLFAVYTTYLPYRAV